MAHRIMNKDLKAAKHPTFEVFTKQGRLKPHLRRAFIETGYISFKDLAYQTVLLNDGSEWPMLIDAEIADKVRQTGQATKCILSCQEDWQGNKIAVVRLYKDKDKDHGTNIS